ncbi:MAG TPA: sulfite exporter TauE/SafE family protein [Burkholderiales bacterium]|nr:sulfite exporter TauE/SafE family protein [Burkholderiales bacterium]
MEWWWLAYLLMGLFVGFFAGLLGIGGGLILVTLMVYLFTLQGFPADRLLHLALGTSITSIVFTSLSSLLAHHRHGAVRWDILRMAVPGLVVGTLLGAFVADQLDSKYLAVFFVIFVYYSALRMFADRKPKPSRQLPGKAGMVAVSLVVGAVSSFVGVGGGVMTIPLMTMCNVPMRQAIGTSAALGLPIAVAGSIGFIATGLGKDHLPALSLGYVYLPALAGIVIGTFVTVPYGARLAHNMPVTRLKKIFAVILFVLATRMLWTLFHVPL